MCVCSVYFPGQTPVKFKDSNHKTHGDPLLYKAQGTPQQVIQSLAPHLWNSVQAAPAGGKPQDEDDGQGL